MVNVNRFFGFGSNCESERLFVGVCFCVNARAFCRYVCMSEIKLRRRPFPCECFVSISE